MQARELIDHYFVEAEGLKDAYVKLVAEVNAFLENGNLSDTGKIRDLMARIKHLAVKIEDMEDELRRLLNVLDGHRRYFGSDEEETTSPFLRRRV